MINKICRSHAYTAQKTDFLLGGRFHGGYQNWADRIIFILITNS